MSQLDDESTKQPPPQSPTSEKALDTHHREELEASGLTDDTIAKSGCFTEHDAGRVRMLLGWSEDKQPGVPALVFPYPGCGDYAQVKLDVPRVSRRDDVRRATQTGNGHAAEMEELLARFNGLDLDSGVPEGEPIKYEKPVGVANRVYVPLGLRADFEDQSVALYITEGEKKALAGCQSGLAMVAVAGVSCFTDSGLRRWTKGEGRDVKRLHPDLRRLIQVGRKVVLCFDSDVDEKPMVLRALAEAVRLLFDQGAEVWVAYIPKAKGGKKVGVDDYLVALPPEERFGARPLEDIENSARPANVEDVLDWVQERWGDWFPKQQRAELARAARLARHLLPAERDLDSWVKRAASALKLTQKAVKEVVPSKTEAERDMPPPRKPREWLRAWAEANVATADYLSDGVCVDGKPLPFDLLLSRVVLDAVDMKAGQTERLLKHALAEWTHQQRDVVLVRCREAVANRPDLGDGEVRRWVRAVTGQERPLDVAAMKHFVWQVKRKLHGQSVDHHLMVVVLGKTGAGKSRAIRQLIAPLEVLTDCPQDMAFVNDERQVFRLTRCFIIFADEMGKAERVCVETLKRSITGDKSYYRQLGFNKLGVGVNVATFIGATNRDVSDIIYDPTGMRRFYQMRSLDIVDWDAINAIDYAALWASVDHEAEAPIKPLLNELRAVQEGLRARDPVEEWLAENCVVGGNHFTKGENLYKNFVDFQKMQGRQPWSLTNWGKRMKELLQPRLGGEGDAWKLSNGVQYRVTIKPDMSAVEAVEEARRLAQAARPGVVPGFGVPRFDNN